MDVAVRNSPDRQRYEALADGAVAGFAEYRGADDLIVFTHTEVDPAHEGQGVGSALVRGALDDARARHLAVLPLCPFVRSWIEHHPDYEDLVYRRPPSKVAD